MGPRGFNAAVIAAVILLIVLRCVFSSIYRRRSGRLSLTNRLSDWFKWHLPVIHWFEKTRAHLQLIEMLKVGLQAGWPVNTVIQNALDLDMNWCFLKRLEQWLSRVEEGQNIAKSAQQCGFDKALIWSFDESINKGNTPQILDALEHLYRSRYHYRINLMNAVCCPLIIVGLGCFVGFVIAGMYLPMVKIIEMFL